MPYNYTVERDEVFTKEGIIMLLKIYDKLNKFPKLFYLEDLINGVTGASWTQIACVDFLVEIKILHEIYYDYRVGQKRIFKKE